MRISVKMVLSGVCLLAGLVLYQGCQKGVDDYRDPKKSVQAEVKPAVKDANPPTGEVSLKADTSAKDVKTEVKEAKVDVKAEVKEAAPEVKPAAPEAKVMVAEPNAGKVAAENNGIAATVNGIVIKDAEVDAKVSVYMERMAAQIPPNMVEQYKTQIRGQALESMIVEQLLAEQLKKAGIDITEKDVNDKLSEIIASQPGGMTMESFKAMIAAQGQSFDVVRGQIKKTLGYEKLLGAVEVNDAEAKAFYDENIQDFNRPE